MNSLQITGSVTINGSAVGTTGHPSNTAPLFLRMMAALTSADTGASLASKALFYADRVLAAGANETFDLTSFSSALEEAGSSMSKVRIYCVYHSSASLATSGIKVGGAATPFPGTKDTAATTDTYPPNSWFIVCVPTTAGMAVTAGMGVKILNLDGSHDATYSIGVFGE